MLGKAPLTSRDVMMRLIGSMPTTASCINMASNGDIPGMAPHMVGDTARYTAGATRLRMSIHMTYVFGLRGGAHDGSPIVAVLPVAFLIERVY